MSAWIVACAHVDVLVLAGVQFGVSYDRQFPRPGPAVLAAAGADLWAENHRSVDHRYDEQSEPDSYPAPTAEVLLDPVAVVKAIDCFVYQSCEHPGWLASQAADCCDRLRVAAIIGLPLEPGDPADKPYPALAVPARPAEPLGDRPRTCGLLLADRDLASVHLVVGHHRWRETVVSETSAHELIVDGTLARDLERLGVHVHAGDRVRLQLVESMEPDPGPVVRWDRLESWRELSDRKRGPFRPAAGTLVDIGPGPDLEDYEEASRLAAEEAGAASRLAE